MNTVIKVSKETSERLKAIAKLSGCRVETVIKVALASYILKGK